MLAFSLIKRFPQDQMLSIHRLVQAVQMEDMQPEEQRQWAHRLVHVLNTAFPPDPSEPTCWPQCLRYLEQVQRCSVLIRQHQLLFPEAAHLLSRAGIYLSEHALYVPAEEMFQQALHILEQQEEVDHVQRAQTKRYLANLYYRQDGDEQAEPLYQQALYVLEQQEEVDRSHVAEILTAHISNNRAKHEEAEHLYLRVLHLLEQMGVEDSRMANLPGGLSWVYVQQGKYEQAEQSYRRALHICEQQGGPAHLSITSPLIGLASVNALKGRYKEAEGLYQRALRIREQESVPRNTETAEVWHDVARFRLARNQYQEAAMFYQRALTIRQQVFGVDHPITKDSYERLQEVLQILET